MQGQRTLDNFQFTVTPAQHPRRHRQPSSSPDIPFIEHRQTNLETIDYHAPLQPPEPVIPVPTAHHDNTDNASTASLLHLENADRDSAPGVSDAVDVGVQSRFSRRRTPDALPYSSLTNHRPMLALHQMH